MDDVINRMPSYLEDVLIENREELIRQLIDIINSLYLRQVIDLDDMQEIKKEERKGRRAGVEKLLEIIHSSGSHGFESLRFNGYTNLVDILQDSYQSISNRDEERAITSLLDSYQSILNRDEERAIASSSRHKATENKTDFGSHDQNYKMGEDINRMSSHFEDVMIENREELIRQLKSSDIINSLFQRKVIDLDDMQEIKTEERKGRRAGVEKLLEKIHFSGSHGFDMFVESLRCNGYTTLVDILQDSYQSISNRAEERAIASSSRHKATENKTDFEKADVKRRGKIPKRHEKILRKNYQRLLREIKTDDIIDYLFTNQLLDWNEMDAIKTRLRSEGNREALSYFILEVLFYSADQALPTFIRCLRKAGYSQIAKRLQDDMDRQ